MSSYRFGRITFFSIAVAGTFAGVTFAVHAVLGPWAEMRSDDTRWLAATAAATVLAALVTALGKGWALEKRGETQPNPNADRTRSDSAPRQVISGMTINSHGEGPVVGVNNGPFKVRRRRHG